MGSKEYIYIIAEKLGTAILKFDGPIYDDYCRLVYEGHTYRITSSLSVEKACNGLLYSDEDSMKLEMRLKSKGWDGLGLPLPGVEFEYLRGDFGADEGRWIKCVMKYAGDKYCIVHLDGEGESWLKHEGTKIRPISSEADKKRDEIILQMSHSLRANGSVTEEQLCRLYADIAAGYIPHIRID